MKRIAIAFMIGALLTLSIPVVADHIVEPMSPVTKLTVQLYWYSHGEFAPMVASSDPSLQTRCDGSVITNFKSLRVEPKVVGMHADGTELRGDPSEHWRLQYQVRLFDKSPNGRPINVRQVWGGYWNHQNIPPHANKASTTGWEAAQTNVGVGAFPGTWLFDFILTGEMTGTVLTAKCQFDSVAPVM